MDAEGVGTGLLKIWACPLCFFIQETFLWRKKDPLARPRSGERSYRRQTVAPQPFWHAVAFGVAEQFRTQA